MTEFPCGLRILITNTYLRTWTGSELYVRDLAIELIKRGHKPVVYSPRVGKLAEIMRSKSIPVVTDLNSVGFTPDIIHGQHHLETMTALAQFPSTPSVFFCHGWLPWEEKPPIHPRILHYVTVSDALHDRLVYECGIPAEKIATILNSVDLERFHPRPPLPAIPRRALVFDNRASQENILGIIKKACSQNGMVMDAVGSGNGNASSSPEAFLDRYEIVFAVGRAALESLATGSAVICCGLEGAGPMVSSQNLAWLRRNNFGIRVLTLPLSPDILSAEIQHYDPLDAQNVCREIRSKAGLGAMVDQIMEVYTTTLADWATSPHPDPVAESLAVSSYLKGISERMYQVVDENMWANEKQGDNILGGSIRRLYHRFNRNPFMQNVFNRCIPSIRRWRARRKENSGDRQAGIP